MPSGMVTDVRLLQFAKALAPILVTELGIVMEVRAVHFQNASFPMLVTVEGIVTEDIRTVLSQS